MQSFLRLTPLLLHIFSISSFAEKNFTKSSSLSCYSGKDLKIQSCDRNVTHCYYTLTIQEKYLTYQKQDADPVYDLSCDVSDVCHNKTDHTFIQMPDDGNVTRHLYCCSENKCNKPENLRKHCHNIFKTDEISRGTKEPCENSESRCLKITTNIDGGDTEYFSCQQNLVNTTQCQNVNTSTVSCFNITLNGGSAELCCCYGDYCLVPTYNYTDIHETLNLTFNGTVWIKGDIHHPISNNKSYTDWLFVGGLISAGVLVLLIIIAAIIIGIKCRKKKETNRLMLSYKRIAADETPDHDDDDIRMLLG